jgi:hypothetical protein
MGWIMAHEGDPTDAPGWRCAAQVGPPARNALHHAAAVGTAAAARSMTA